MTSTRIDSGVPVMVNLRLLLVSTSSPSATGMESSRVAVPSPSSRQRMES